MKNHPQLMYCNSFLRVVHCKDLQVKHQIIFNYYNHLSDNTHSQGQAVQATFLMEQPVLNLICKA